jgi:DNA-binding CsgD family transcriptional regulator
MLPGLIADTEVLLRASSADEASRLFYSIVEPLGASYLQTRVYRRPSARLTSASHYAAGGLIARISPTAWPGSAAFNYVCFECNPLLTAIREGRTRYRFSDFAPQGERRFGDYWEALGEAGIADALCATSYGEGRTIASLHLGFATRDLSPADGSAVQLAGLVLTECLMSLADPPPEQAPMPRLSVRERDALAFVAEGKTDWEISVILGVSEATARYHVDNARRKLQATNRTHAVARLINLRQI